MGNPPVVAKWWVVKDDPPYGMESLRERVGAMALQLGALLDALLDAGAKPEKADKAAEELATYETRLVGIDTKLALLTWMVGFNLILTVGVLWRLLSH